MHKWLMNKFRDGVWIIDMFESYGHLSRKGQQRDFESYNIHSLILIYYISDDLLYSRQNSNPFTQFFYYSSLQFYPFYL